MSEFDARLEAMEHAVRLIGADSLPEDLIEIASYISGPPTSSSGQLTIPEILVRKNPSPETAAEEVKRRYRIAERRKDEAVIADLKTQKCCKDEEAAVDATTFATQGAADPFELARIRNWMNDRFVQTDETGQERYLIRAEELKVLATVLDELLGPVDVDLA